MTAKIIIIDDDQMMSNSFAKRLEKRGFEVSLFHSGKEGLLALETVKPHLVLLDIMMPEMDGNEVLRAIRANYNHISMPVIMLTAKENAEDVVSSLQAGANDFLSKPANMDIAMARINTFIEIRKLSEESVKKKELETLNSLIVTYNHEINNPLAAAMGFLELAKVSKEEKHFQKITVALERIRDIVKKIKDVVNNEDVVTTDYAKDDKAKLLKIG